MSEYSDFDFVALPEVKESIVALLSNEFDAFSVKFKQADVNGYDWYSLTISELDLKESLKLVDLIHSFYPNVIFVVNYGVYYK